MTRLFLRSLVCISLFAIGCKTKPPTSTTDKFEITSAEDVLSEKRQERKMRCTPILSASQYSENGVKTNMITHADIQKGCLNISYAYSGCEQVKANVYYKRIENTTPQALALFVAVSEAGDCDMLLEGEGSFNLGDLEGHTAGKVILHLEGYDQPFTYIYTAE